MEKLFHSIFFHHERLKLIFFSKVTSQTHLHNLRLCIFHSGNENKINIRKASNIYIYHTAIEVLF